MKFVSKLPINVTLLISAGILMLGASRIAIPYDTVSENTIVTLKFKTQPDKSDIAIAELKTLFQEVKKEPHFVSIKLHVDPTDNTNILLYEEWEDGEYYQTTHMETEHLTAFMTASREFLAGPPEISFWTVEGEFK